MDAPDDSDEPEIWYNDDCDHCECYDDGDTCCNCGEIGD